MAWYNYFTVEIPLLLTTFALMLQMAVFTNLSIYRACYTLLDFPKDNCSELGNKDNDNTEWLEPQVQPTVNKINMVQSTIQSTVPLIICMYIGLWSDKFGRRPFLIASFVGTFLTITLNTLIVYFESLSPWWFIAGAMPSFFTGGMGSLMLLITTYIADITTKEQRALRLSFFDVIFALSSFLGNSCSSYLLYATNYVVVYLLCMGLIGLSLLYTIFFIPESLKKTEEAPKSGDRMQLANFKDLIRDTFKKRPNNGRVHLLTIMGIMLVQNFSMGEMSVLVLFLRGKMHWTLQKITVVNSVTSVINILGTVFGTVVLYKMLKVKEFHLALLSTVLSIVASILRAIATNDMYIYGAYAATIFRGMGAIMLRTVISFIISPQEMGKIFAVTSILTSIDELIANLVYPNVYNATLNTNSGIFNYISAVMTGIGGLLIIYMMISTFTHYEPPTMEEREEAEFQKKKSITFNNLEVLTASQRMSLEIDARTFSIRSISNVIH